MSDREWLERLTEGDEVIWYSGSFNKGRAIITVERVTATQIVADGKRFNKETGRQIGTGRGRRSYYLSCLEEPTAERVAAVREQKRRSRLVAALENTNWDELPTTALERAWRAIHEAGETQEEQG